MRRASESRNIEYSKSRFLEYLSDGVTVFQGFMYTDMGQQQEASAEKCCMAEPRDVLHGQNKEIRMNTLKNRVDMVGKIKR